MNANIHYIIDYTSNFIKKMFRAKKAKPVFKFCQY